MQRTSVKYQQNAKPKQARRGRLRHRENLSTNLPICTTGRCDIHVPSPTQQLYHLTSRNVERASTKWERGQAKKGIIGITHRASRMKNRSSQVKNCRSGRSR